MASGPAVAVPKSGYFSFSLLYPRSNAAAGRRCSWVRDLQGCNPDSAAVVVRRYLGGDFRNDNRAGGSVRRERPAASPRWDGAYLSVPDRRAGKARTRIVAVFQRELRGRHFHIDMMQYPLLRALSVSAVALHGRLDLPDLQSSYLRFLDMPLVSISDAQQSPMPPVNWICAIYRRLPSSRLPPNTRL